MWDTKDWNSLLYGGWSRLMVGVLNSNATLSKTYIGGYEHEKHCRAGCQPDPRICAVAEEVISTTGTRHKAGSGHCSLCATLETVTNFAWVGRSMTALI